MSYFWIVTSDMVHLKVCEDLYLFETPDQIQKITNGGDNSYVRVFNLLIPPGVRLNSCQMWEGL